MLARVNARAAAAIPLAARALVSLLLSLSLLAIRCVSLSLAIFLHTAANIFKQTQEDETHGSTCLPNRVSCGVACGRVVQSQSSATQALRDHAVRCVSRLGHCLLVTSYSSAAVLTRALADLLADWWQLLTAFFVLPLPHRG